MKFYNDYYDIIKSAMSQRETREFSYDEKNQGLGSLVKSFLNESLEDTLLPSLETFATATGRRADFTQKLGSHPDFEHLKGTNDIENHYIVSTFIDIKGSTNLYKKYNNEIVLIVTQTIQKAAIHTCLLFGGYIQRLQGDGVFVYFGGKQVSKADAIKNALTATSMFTYFVKNDLKNLFEEQDIKRIATRIGIDLGYDEDVIWMEAGLGETSEITTSSLHTNLAAKMQVKAVSNGIVVGDNVKKNLETDHYTVVSDRTGEKKDRYIFRNQEDGFYYTQYDFNWLNFLKEQDFIATDLNGDLHFKEKPAGLMDSASLKTIAVNSTPYYNF